MTIILRPHQQAAYDKWVESGTEGIVKAITGTGKTHIALKAIEENPNSIWIVVPTIPLQEQWEQMIKLLNVPYSLLGGGSNETCDGVVIAVDKSFQSYIKSHGSLNVRLLVLDEIHRMCSPENFDALSKVNYTSVLGLSATPEREDNANWLHMVGKIPIIYEHTLEDAQEQGTICEFEMVVAKAELTEDERIKYMELTALGKEKIKLFKNYRTMISLIKYQEDARIGVKAYNERARLIANSRGKIIKAAEIINNSTSKCILFSEQISSIEILKTLIKNKEAFVYHSQIHKKERKQIIENFKKSVGGVLLSCRALDEGIDVPSCDTAIILSGTSKSRQFVQRIGRVLRPQEGKKALIYECVVKNTVDVDWARKRKQI